MPEALENIHVGDGDPVTAEHLPLALSWAPLLYDDGAVQTFDPTGATTYVENGRPTYGEWYVDDDGRFCSFWPPRYRACYDLHWIVEDRGVAGLRFTELGRRSHFSGRYQNAGSPRRTAG